MRSPGPQWAFQAEFIDMKRLALASIALSLGVVSLVAQSSDGRLDRAMERIERNDLNGLRRLLTEDPSLVR
jgi:hypothetical protein